MKHKNFCFKVWQNPHAWIALGRATAQQLHIVYIDGVGLVDGKYTSLQNMLASIATERGNPSIDGWGLSLINDDFFNEEYRILRERYSDAPEEEWETVGANLEAEFITR